LKQIHHTAPWITQCIHEDKYSSAIGILRAWTHIDRQPEANKTTIEQLNQLTDEEVVITLQELGLSKQYIQGSGGNHRESKDEMIKLYLYLKYLKSISYTPI
jgi:hypothetical protein